MGGGPARCDIGGGYVFAGWLVGCFLGRQLVLLGQVGLGDYNVGTIS